MARIKPSTKQHARDLRRDMTDAERILWRQLRKNQILGFRFRRQHPIGPYIADFACVDARLMIEIDGGQHAQQGDYDTARTDWLSSQGYKVLRFWNNEILTNLDGVMETIVRELQSCR